MVQNKSTFYSLAGSLAVNMMITMGAGSFLISINKSLATQKTYKLEFVKKKTPPLIKKKKINKEIVRQVVKVASLQPKAVPITQPKMTVRQTSSSLHSVSIPNYVPRQIQTQETHAMRSAVIHTVRSTMNRRVTSNIPIARSLASVNKKTSQNSMKKMAVVNSANHTKAHKIPTLVARSSANTSTSKSSKGRVTPLLTGMKHASLFIPNPRGVPNIVDSGALKGYLGQIQRIIEGAKEYPEASRRAGREGKVKIQFTIFRNGNVDDIKLLTRTPYPNLNQEAIDAVERSAPFSGFPDSLTQKSVKVILPFRFELR
ncbi:energy transducer TonB [Nitrospinae bacterium]|nr:energy transducer TonB [Nitrospinota bacterium]